LLPGSVMLYYLGPHLAETAEKPLDSLRGGGAPVITTLTQTHPSYDAARNQTGSPVIPSARETAVPRANVCVPPLTRWRGVVKLGLRTGLAIRITPRLIPFC
jgi:hypothetical protein